MESSLNWLLDLLTEDSSAAAVIAAHNGDILSLKHETVADYGCLPAVKKVVSKYFNPKPGEVIVTNDPFSGGHVHNFLFLVTSFTDQIQWTSKVGFKAQLSKSNETFRVPPMPIATNYSINQAMLEAMCSHPEAPSGLAEKLKSEIENLWRKEKKLKVLLKLMPHLMSKTSIDTFCKDSRDFFNSKWREALEPGDHRLEINLNSSETLRLKVEITQNKTCHVDFSGTSKSLGTNLTTAVVEGCCYSAIAAFCSARPWMTDALIKNTQITSPSGSFLNSTAPASTSFGMFMAAPLIADAILFCLTKLAHQKNWIPNAYRAISYSFEFAETKYFENLPAGISTNLESQGLSGTFFWIKNNMCNSIQINEKLYPLRILKEKTRKPESKSSRGGRGIHKEVELHEDAIFRWILPSPVFNSTELKTASVEKSKIFIVHEEQTTEVTHEQGQLDLKKGDRVIFQSSGF